MQVRCADFVLKLVETCSRTSMATMAEIFTNDGNDLCGIISVTSNFRVFFIIAKPVARDIQLPSDMV